MVDTAEELVLARNAAADENVDQNAASAAPSPVRPGPSEATGWTARRVRTGGAEVVLRVERGGKAHVVEYRAAYDRTAVIVLDGVPIHRGHYEVNHEFRLGRRGPWVRLSVTGEPNVELWVDGTRLYGLRHAAPGSDDFVEHRAHVIRNVLLAVRDECRREKKAAPPGQRDHLPKVNLAPEIPATTARTNREPTRPGMPPDQVVGVYHTGFPWPMSFGAARRLHRRPGRLDHLATRAAGTPRPGPL